MSSEKKQVFIIGSKGIPAQYGGFETFVEKLTEYQKDNAIQYYVACMNAEKNDLYTMERNALMLQCLILEQQRLFIMILQH